MGMYTRLTLWVEIDNDAANAINRPQLAVLWPIYRSSYSFITSQTEVRYDHITQTHMLTVDCSCKNYSNDINNFLDWLRPHVLHTPNSFVGFTQYEEDSNPTLIHFINDQWVFTKVGE